jgi:PAS domain S-box-containing protein
MEDISLSGLALTEDGRYRLLVDAITDYAVYMLDPTGTIVSWNAGARRSKGYDATEIIGQHFSRFFTEEDRKKNLPGRALQIAVREGRFETEGWRVRKNGTTYWAHVVIDPIWDENGGILGFAKITRDLTERKQAEQALNKSEEQFRLLVQSVTDYAIYMLDAQGRITNWNAGAEKIKGYLPEEIIGEHFSRFYTEEDRAKGEPQRGLDTAAKVGRFEKEGWRVRKDGTRFWANVVIDAIRDDSGKIIGFAKVTRDVTERVQAQRALEQAREAFFQSQKAEALGQLTGGIAHDFNNLLMVILSSLELLQKRVPEDPKITRLINNAVQGAQRGASLTQRMLAFARRQDLKAEPVDIAALVYGMIDLLERSLGPAISIETSFPPNLPPANADANQLELALLNLGVNARDATPNGGPINITAREQDASAIDLPPGRYICLAVIDDGTGMDEATLGRATEPFFTTKGVGKGTGLGLSMVHGMAEQLGGRFVLKSRKDEGTTAEIWLPIAQAHPAVENPDAHHKEPERASDCQTPIVLVVDDDNLVLVNMASMLEDAGYTVVQAASGVEALNVLRNDERIDVMVTDQAMPNMTGSELAETIKAERPLLPIILASGYADLPHGTSFVLPRLTKPFRQAEIVAAVSEAIRNRVKQLA